MIAKSHRWRGTAIATAALIALWGSNASALSLGRVSVQLALGEPLRAEIEVPDINPEEASSLKATVALPDAFRAAGLEYNAALSTMQVTLQKRADGRTYIRLSSDRPINDPFVDLIIQASWASGRIVRDFTMLFDPPSLRQTAAAATQTPTRPSISSAPLRPPGVPAAVSRPTPSRTASSRPAATPPIANGQDEGDGQVVVKPGDTASKIAAATKPANVSLDQMLVALLRANPSAFVGDNVNRVKAGSIMNVPTAEQAAATAPSEATQIIVAQSRDFNDFRRRLADVAPTTSVGVADRKVSGAVQATVEDKKPATLAPDKLTLSKGGLQKPPIEDQIAKERSAREVAGQAAEITKNIDELSKIGAASGAVSSAASAAPGLPVAVLPPASAASVAMPSAAVSAAATKPPATTPAAQPDVGLIEGLMAKPLIPGAIVLAALLAALGVYRAKQRRNASNVDSVFLESRLRPDSFFGASGGQSVDTNDHAAPGSSVVYSPSQLDAVDDVDPVAEADVYLAYGRDLQAEEILRDALRSKPGRIAIHQKLLDIFSKRGDAKSFENIAALAYKVTNGDGPEWQRICDMGLGIDPNNLLYLPGGQPTSVEGQPPSPVSLAGGAVDLDLDFDFALDEAPASAISETTASTSVSGPTTHAMELDVPTQPVAPLRKASAPATTEATANSVDFTVPDQEFKRGGTLIPTPVNSDSFKSQVANSFGPTAPAPLEATLPAAPQPEKGMLEFDLSSLSLDLGEPELSEPVSTAAVSTPEDPLATKLALAQEFSAIGDDDGARALINEVMAEASGDMKVKAQSALNNL